LSIANNPPQNESASRFDNATAAPTQFTLGDFDFELPEELIAQTPPQVRGQSRLLVVEPEQLVQDSMFAEVISKLRRGDALVMNNTKVIPARLFATKPTGGKVEMLVERVLSHNEFLAQIKASHKPKVGLQLALGVSATLTTNHNVADSQTSTNHYLTVIEYRPPFVVMQTAGSALETLQTYGEIPLPPYIARKPSGSDLERYQTVYAKSEGAVAAPTAGLHFTQEMLGQLEQNGVQLIYLTLHVGAGTFQPVRTDNLAEHKMHSEWFEISDQAANAINNTIASGNKVVAVGTTSLRALESAATKPGHLQATTADTSIFITPGFKFKIVDALITNFHLPKSTLMMLVSAFAGFAEIKAAYSHAIAQQYRFFSYGDAMWLTKKQEAQ
jgi:S-adenosylmethionine:tRNA ribosyltransferase-isomerase